MKKYIILLPCAVFPYSLLFAVFCIFTGSFMNTLFSNNAYILLFYIFLLFIISLICNISFLILSISQKWSSGKIAYINMIIRLIQIPAYILIFTMGIICMLTIFTFGFSVLFIGFDCMSIFLTGLIGISASVRCCFDGKITKSSSIIHSLFQFVFCADIISAVIIFLKAKSYISKQ